MLFRSALLYDAQSRGALAYLSLARELSERLGSAAPRSEPNTSATSTPEEAPLDATSRDKPLAKKTVSKPKPKATAKT